ncbi:MAG: hypothetical protein JRJ51_25275 [Deltaproteobacteria bacterium]|nr:hypothetical protein [Deltaproteobacteria bacterium]
MKKRVTAKRNLSIKMGMVRLCLFFMLSLVGCSPHYLPSDTDGEYDNTHIHTKDIHRVLGDVAPMESTTTPTYTRKTSTGYSVTWSRAYIA